MVALAAVPQPGPERLVVVAVARGLGAGGQVHAGQQSGTSDGVGGGYFTVTVRVAEPPALLLTVTLCGFDVAENVPPPPESVPMSAPVPVL